jgi:hypothetical protein
MPPLINAFINNSTNLSFLLLPNRVMKQSRDEDESVDICDEGLISSTIISSSEFCPEADGTGDPEGGSGGSDSSGLTDSRDLILFFNFRDSTNCFFTFVGVFEHLIV